MATKHTPGPWRANASLVEAPRMALTVATVCWPRVGCAPRTEDEAKANVRVLVAAPELLAALKDVLRIARAATIHSGGDHNRKRIAAAEAVIAKAEAA